MQVLKKDSACPATGYWRSQPIPASVHSETPASPDCYGRANRWRHILSFTKSTVSGIIYGLLSLTLGVNANAQESSPASTLSVGYFGELVTHPGFTLGIERSLSTTKHFTVFATGEVGGYTHTRNQTGVFADVQTGYRFKTRSGFFFDQALGLGYLHTFLNGGKLFEVSADRQAYEVADGGRPHIMPLVRLGTGYDFSSNHRGNWLVYARMRFFWQYPFNHYALVHTALEAGLSKTLTWKK